MYSEHSEFILVILNLARALLTVSLGAALLRLIIGPRAADRVMALDFAAGVALAFLVLLALETGHWLYLDIAFCIALIAFLGTVAYARFMNDWSVDETVEEDGGAK